MTFQSEINVLLQYITFPQFVQFYKTDGQVVFRIKGTDKHMCYLHLVIPTGETPERVAYYGIELDVTMTPREINQAIATAFRNFVMRLNEGQARTFNPLEGDLGQGNG